MERLVLPGFSHEAGSPIRRQYNALKQQYPDCILFFQLGDFYETFEDDARIVAEVCDVALTSRELGQGERVPLAGVPVHSVETYLARLVERGYHVAICQQMAPPTSVKGLVPRQVVRVVTPGTLVESELLPQLANNYLAAVASHGKAVGLSYADISTGEWFATQVEGGDARDLLVAELARLRPAELLAPSDGPPLDLSTGEGVHVSPLDSAAASPERAWRALLDHFGTATLEGIGLHDAPAAAAAAGALLLYVQRTQPAALALLDRVHRYDVQGYMVLDAATRRNLELTSNLRSGTTDGTLLSVLDRTRTPMGSRLLRRWIAQPLLDVEAIRRRQDAIAELVAKPLPMAELGEALGRVGDLERLANRAGQGLLAPRECLGLRRSLEAVAALREGSWIAELPMLAEALVEADPCQDALDALRSTLVDEPPSTVGEGVIRPGRSAELDELRAMTRDTERWIAELERSERERTGVRSLRIGYNRVFGYYIEVSQAALGQPTDHFQRQQTGASTVAELLDRLGYVRKQTLANAERFVTQALKEQEARLERAQEQILALEQRLYQELLGILRAVSPRMLRTARTLARLDALQSLAQVAVSQGYVRPEVTLDVALEIVDGRHPVVEQRLGPGRYVPSDCRLRARFPLGLATADGGAFQGLPRRRTDPAQEGVPGSSVAADGGGDAPAIAILTGPNMAGKTTYGRMVLLVVLMAQIGSYVPARSARVGLVDRLFLRAGAFDDIAGGQSTFMVEMLETANILRSATPRSLVFLDEVGRGTSTYDGMALARAIVEYIHDDPRLGCRTIFSTHYHELGELEERLPGVRNYRMEIRDDGREVVFLYRVAPGRVLRSYGVHVARLAGLPPAVTARAEQLLETLERQPSRVTPDDGPTLAGQAAPALHPVVAELRQLDVLSLTPIQALTKLHELREKALDD
ncbi:MAG TPA: DNA mismatch repair protein MutS [Chloroflexota bacterium]